MTQEEFKEICRKHDLTYVYSDDHGVWKRGNASLAKVREAADKLDTVVAMNIWNSVVDEKIIEGYRDAFYWRI